MKTLRVQCPHCGGSSKLFLASNPLILVLNCPQCQSPLLNSEGETFKVEDTKIVNMENHQIKEYIKSLKENQAMESSDYPEPESPMRLLSPSRERVLTLSGRPHRKIPIGEDDLLNLKIDLESSMDVTEFIDRL